MAEVAPLPYSCGRLIVILIGCMIFLSLFLDVINIFGQKFLSLYSETLEFTSSRIVFLGSTFNDNLHDKRTEYSFSMTVQKVIPFDGIYYCTSYFLDFILY